jgi:hypothetical protein
MIAYLAILDLATAMKPFIIPLKAFSVYEPT